MFFGKSFGLFIKKRNGGNTIAHLTALLQGGHLIYPVQLSQAPERLLSIPVKAVLCQALQIPTFPILSTVFSGVSIH